jgi:hypothetical protein
VLVPASHIELCADQPQHEAHEQRLAQRVTTVAWCDPVGSICTEVQASLLTECDVPASAEASSQRNPHAAGLCARARRGRAAFGGLDINNRIHLTWQQQQEKRRHKQAAAVQHSARARRSAGVGDVSGRGVRQRARGRGWHVVDARGDCRRADGGRAEAERRCSHGVPAAPIDAGRGQSWKLFAHTGPGMRILLSTAHVPAATRFELVAAVGRRRAEGTGTWAAAVALGAGWLARRRAAPW